MSDEPKSERRLRGVADRDPVPSIPQAEPKRAAKVVSLSSYVWWRAAARVLEAGRALSRERLPDEETKRRE